MDLSSDNWVSRRISWDDSRRNSPSPEEIRAACEEIQRDWSEKERRRRAGQPWNFVRLLECPTPSLPMRASV